MLINFALNGRPTRVDAHPATLLLDVLHHEQKISSRRVCCLLKWSGVLTIMPVWRALVSALKILI